MELTQDPNTGDVKAKPNGAVKKIDSGKSKVKRNNKHREAGAAFQVLNVSSNKSVSIRTIPILNKQIENNLKYCSRITKTIMTITGSLVRCSKFDIQKEFDGYVDTLLDVQTIAVQNELNNLKAKKEAFEAQGYEFVGSGKPGLVKIEIRSNHTAKLVELILLLDECVTTASYLEKTTALTTPELYEMVSQWRGVPRLVFSRLSTLMDKLDKQFRFKPAGTMDAASASDVKFDDVLAFMKSLRDKEKRGSDSDNSPAENTSKTETKVVDEDSVAKESVNKQKGTMDKLDWDKV